MNYHNITKDDMLNGEGLRTVFWLSGCSHHCKNCQNPITWDPINGVPFDLAAKEELFGYLDKEYCSGLTLSGGDPLYFDNWVEVLDLVREFRRRYKDTKTIWLYTGYEMRDIKNNPILKYVDVVVDGKFIESQKNTKRLWCGSDNQIIWRRREDRWIPDPKEYDVSLNELEAKGACCEDG